MWLAGERPVLVVSFSQYGFGHINQKGSGENRSPFFVVDGVNSTDISAVSSSYTLVQN